MHLVILTASKNYENRQTLVLVRSNAFWLIRLKILKSISIVEKVDLAFRIFQLTTAIRTMSVTNVRIYLKKLDQN